MEFDYYQNYPSNDLLIASNPSAYLDADHLQTIKNSFQAFGNNTGHNFDIKSIGFSGFPDKKLFPLLINDYASSYKNKSRNLFDGYHQYGTPISTPPTPPQLPKDHYFLNRVSMVQGVELQCFNDSWPTERTFGMSFNQTCTTVSDIKLMPAFRRNSNGATQKKGNIIKGQWTFEEDKLLMKLVEQYGIKKWSNIAQMLKGRIGKQCRDRWHNHLRPNIKKDSWSEEEDKILIEAHSQIGNKWSEIAKKLPGRTENSIKNHWNATKRKQFARRRCRGSKHSKSSGGSLLQDYIKNLSLLNPSSLPTVSKESGSATITSPLLPIPVMPADAAWDDFIDVAEEFMMLDKETTLMEDISVVGDTLLGFGGESSSGNCSKGMWDLEQYLSMGSDVKVKKEMDLMEMISDHQNSSCSSSSVCDRWPLSI